MLNIALVHPDIAENVGQIIRTCCALKARLHLIRPLGFQLDESRLKRPALDYYQMMKPHLVVHDNLEAFLKTIENKNAYYLSSKGIKKYSDISFTAEDFLIFGSESKGFPEEIYDKMSENLYKIPMPGPVRCLNLAASVAVVAFEGARQLESKL